MNTSTTATPTNKITEYGAYAWKGAVVGSAMLLPGISGGTTAIMLGIYDRLIGAIGDLLSIFKKDYAKFLKAVLFLATFCVGALIGFLLFAKLILSLVTAFEYPMKFLFLGAVIGTIPLLYLEGIVKDNTNKLNISGNKPAQEIKTEVIAENKKIKAFGVMDCICIIAGFAVAFVFSLMPKDLFIMSGALSFADVLLLFVAGLILAVALVLPGISVSYTMLIFGIYERTLKAVSDLDVAFLFPLAFGLAIGVLATAVGIGKSLESNARETYLIIGGFVLASVFELFPGIPQTTFQVAVCITTLGAGFCATFLLSKWKGAKIKGAEIKADR